MTNFEKWQQTLPENDRVSKPEDLIIDRGPDIDEKEEFRHVVKLPCKNCPCLEKCGREHDYWRGCSDIFQEWAKEETK